MAKRYPPDVRAQAVAAKVLGESSRSIARRLGVSHLTVDKWFDQDGARMRPRTQEALGDLVYDTLVVSLRGLHARAVATSKPAWIEKQSAEALARLDEVTWNQLLRVISSLRPTTPDRSIDAAGSSSSDDNDGGEGAEDRGYAAAGADGRNGAVDPAA